MLVVGFAGNFMRLMIPTYRVLLGLDPERIDLLLLSDPLRAGFMRGLEGVGSTLEAVEEFLNSFVSDHGYRDVVALGTSGGGMPAIHAALANHWRRVVAVDGNSRPTHGCGRKTENDRAPARSGRHGNRRGFLVRQQSGRRRRIPAEGHFSGGRPQTRSPLRVPQPASRVASGGPARGIHQGFPEVAGQPLLLATQPRGWRPGRRAAALLLPLPMSLGAA